MYVKIRNPFYSSFNLLDMKTITIDTVTVKMLIMDSLIKAERRHGRTRISALCMLNMQTYVYRVLGYLPS